jgi:hypothetical protein
MGIAGVEPRQLAPTMGTTGSGSTDSLAPSPTIDNLTASTRFDGPTSAMAVDSTSPLDIDSDINFDTSGKIDIDSTINTAVGIAMPAIINTNPSEAEVDIAGSTLHCQAPPNSLRLRTSSTLPQARQEQPRR